MIISLKSVTWCLKEPVKHLQTHPWLFLKLQRLMLGPGHLLPKLLMSPFSIFVIFNSNNHNTLRFIDQEKMTLERRFYQAHKVITGRVRNETRHPVFPVSVLFDFPHSNYSNLVSLCSHNSSTLP